MGPFITAYVKVNGRSEAARQQASEWLLPLKYHLAYGGLGQLSELFDGDAPQLLEGASRKPGVRQRYCGLWWKTCTEFSPRRLAKS